jgi:hypothetical protein
MATARARLSETAWSRAWEKGKQMTVEGAIEAALGRGA